MGEKYGALFGTYFNRDDQGRIIHEMSQGYPRPSLNTSRKILGFGVPPQQLGIGASFRYKDFNASFLVEGKAGGQIFSGTNLRLIGYGLHKKCVDTLNLIIILSLKILGTNFNISDTSFLKKNQSYIIVSNHQSAYDIPPIIWFLRSLHPKFISKKRCTLL